jgi:3D (Asp-Asp-Asp) domain-containing protein
MSPSIPRTPRRLPPSAGLTLTLLCALAAVVAAAACARLQARAPKPGARTLVVTATAYTSAVEQTDAEPNLAAWSDRLTPGMRAIAVSPDLVTLGLERGTEVRIAGLPGRWRVLDRMPARWSRRIDVYMGDDVQAARDWGKRRVRISW